MRALKANPIQELRRILRDQYDFNSILKELIQNADDAGAAQFHVAWMSDWPNSLHPLLRSPAIVVLNDGEFTKANAEAICNIDVGSKGSDLRATGKFGLGMKSVFHICEAFFYLSSSNQPAAQDNFYFELLNPWMSMDLHGSWGSNLDEVGSFLFKKIRAWEHKCDRWFALVFPLRTEEQLEGKAPIVSYIPDIKNFITKEIYRQIIFLVPLLRSLKRIAVWDWSEKKLSKKSEFGILADSKTRCSFPDIEKNIIKTISGDVRIHGTSLSQEIVTNFSGVERLCDDPSFQRLKEDSRWPISATLDSKTGEYKDEPDKAEPHCAAVFSSFPSGSQESGTLYIKHALFLPLAKNLVKIRCSLDSDFQLLLHGHYFLDAGRKEIYKRNDHLKGLEEEWNESLLDINVYPLVLPAFDEFVKNSNLNPDRVLCLTKSIGKTPFYYENRSKLCNDYHWIGAVHKETENSNISWHLVESSNEFFKLPPPRNGTSDLPVRVFPALKQLCRNCNVTYNNLPYLSASEPLCWSEKPDFLSQIIVSLEKDAFKDDQKLDYLVRFVTQEKSFLPDDVLRLFVKQIANVLGETGLENVRTHQKKFREFIRLLGEKSCISFSTDGLGIHGDEIFSELLKIDIGLLILPDDLAPEPLDGQVMPVEESAIIFDRLVQLKIPNKIKSVFALELLEKTIGTVEEKRTKLGGYALFHCRSYAEGNDYYYSWKELDNLIMGKRLFAGRSAYAPPLQKALADITLFRLVEPSNRKPFKILFNLADPPSCDKIACLEILRKTPILKTTEYRDSIFKRLIGCPENYEKSNYIRTMRYLIHGSVRNFQDNHTFLLTKPQSKIEGVLGKVARSAFKKRGEEWRWASGSIIEHLPSGHFNELSIRHIDFDAIEELLQEGNIDWLTDLFLNDNERKTLLHKIRNESVWLCLPFHETVDGQRIAVTSSLYFYQGNEDFSIPQSMGKIVTVIRRSYDALLNEKYLRCISSWNEEALLSVICEQSEPVNFCIDIINVFERIQNKKIQHQLKEQLKITPWIPINSSSYPPSEIINLPDVDNELYRILSDSEIKESFFCTEQIKDRVKDHPGFAIVRRRLFPSRSESLEILGLCLQSCKKYHIGTLNKLGESPKALKIILTAFDGASPDLIPGWDLIKILKEETDDSLIEKHLLPNLANEIELQRTINCLKFLSQKHMQVNTREKKYVFMVFNWYLESLLKDEVFTNEHLKMIELLNRNGEWKSPQQLCFGSEGIDGEHLLDLEQTEILGQVKNSNRNAPQENPDQGFPTQLSGDLNTLNEYFTEWEQFIPLPVIGGFISFFGDDPKNCELSNEYLDPRSLKNFREMIDWDLLQNYRVNGVLVAGANENIHKSMERQRIKVRIHSQNSDHYVPNLIGEWFTAKISESYQNIFIGNFETTRMEGYRCYTITLRQIDPSYLTGHELTELLYESARILISKVYIRNPNNLRALWDDLSQTDQLELEIVQHQIIENAFLYFKQLGAGNLPKLWPITQEWKKLHRRLVEIEHAGTKGQNIDDASIKDQTKKLRANLKEMVESDRDVQIEAVNAVKDKMEKNFQYSRSSIPFELFQNSDDAALELEGMSKGSPTLPLLAEVKVICDDQRLLWMHWGRHINEFRRGNFTSEMGRQLGYDADLENMLFLSSTDKESRKTKVTGKYGLGFKSVFLLTDRPKILSRHLSFEVTGGFFPKYLNRSERERLMGELNSYAPQLNSGTIIELKNNNKDSNAIPETITHFKELVSLMLIFSRKIKKCSLQENYGKPKIIAWHEKPIMDCEHVFFGKANLSFDAAEPSNFLILRGLDNGAFLIGVWKKGINKLPNIIPTFWVTAPTSEKLDLGFAVNGPFTLDIGRTQIASDSAQNMEQASQLGRDIGKALTEMFKASLKNWSQFCEALELIEEDISFYSFWDSVWICIGKDLARAKYSQSTSVLLIRKIFWGEDLGMANFIEKQKAMPSGLTGIYKCLSDPESAKYEIQGIIDHNPDFFLKISKLESFSQRIKPGEVVSHAKTGFVLKRLFPKEWKPISLKLLDIIQWEIDENRTVTPELSDRLEEVISKRFFDEIDKTIPDLLKEGQEIKDYLKNLRFITDSGEIIPSEEKGFLIRSGKDEEESLRASFAPDDRVLNADYNSQGIEFFKTCRPQMHAPTEILLQWALKAKDKKRRIHLLKYLLFGELCRGLGDLLRKDLPDWLKEIKDSAYFKSEVFRGDEQLRLLGILGFQIQDFDSEPDTIQKPIIIHSPDLILRKIFQWWKNNEKRLIRKYEEQIYVGGKFPKISKDGPKNQTEKVEWIKLFLHGVLHTMGRTGESANKKFIKKCNERKWLFHLANADTQPNTWLKIFDEYIDEQVQDIKFFHWMKQLIGLFIIARRLDDYVDAFLAINIIEDPFSLNQITDTRASEIFQGGGPDAPPISRILGMGAWFIIRELVRKGIIENEHAHKHCYVPVKRVRAVIQRLDGPLLENLSKKEQSIRIYEFLVHHLGTESATFQNSFDIPFQMIKFFDETLDADELEDEEE